MQRARQLARRTHQRDEVARGTGRRSPARIAGASQVSDRVTASAVAAESFFLETTLWLSEMFADAGHLRRHQCRPTSLTMQTPKGLVAETSSMRTSAPTAVGGPPRTCRRRARRRWSAAAAAAAALGGRAPRQPSGSPPPTAPAPTPATRPPAAACRTPRPVGHGRRSPSDAVSVQAAPQLDVRHCTVGRWHHVARPAAHARLTAKKPLVCKASEGKRFRAPPRAARQGCRSP